MRVLLAGGTGYIGSHTTYALMASGHNVIIADNFCNSSIEVIHRLERITNQSLKLYELDIKDKNGLRKAFGENAIDCVIHFAGLKAVGESIEHPLMYYRNNIDTTLTLLECMRGFGVNNIVFSS